MAKFKVGQRVRFVRNENFRLAPLLGSEGVIVAQGPYGHWAWRPDNIHLCPFLETMNKYQGCVFSPDHHLEPAIDRPDLSTWEACGFHPDDFLKKEKKDVLA